MSESSRIKFLELAVQAGATIKNATKVADDWERWATEDDPLRLDTPGPKWQHESEIPESDYQRIHADLHGIDWSRPQLVVSKYDDTMIVRTTGLNGFDEFEGFSDEDGDTPDWYKKKRFKYHGEIEEPKNDNKWTDSEFMEWIYERMKHVHGESEYADYMIRFKSILDKNKNGGGPREEKTTGLNFLEAIQACKSGKRVAREVWDNYGCISLSGDRLVDENGDTYYTNNAKNILATDWQIVKS